MARSIIGERLGCLTPITMMALKTTAVSIITVPLTLKGLMMMALKNYGSFNNYGTIDIEGAYDDGIQNEGNFNNYGHLYISAAYGIYGLSGSFSNSGYIEIAYASTKAISNTSSSTIFNQNCAVLHIREVSAGGEINDPGDGISNNGTIVSHASGSSNIYINEGNVYNAGTGTFTADLNFGNIYNNDVSAEAVWTGGTSNDWWNGCNWSQGFIPLHHQNIRISGSALNMPVLSNDVNVDSTLTIEAGASLSIMEKGGIYFPNEIHNYGSLINYGSIGDTYEELNIYNYATLNNWGRIRLGGTWGDAIQNYGTINNYDWIYIFAHDDGIKNHGTLNNYKTMSIGGYNTITNINGIKNEGTINNEGGMDIGGFDYGIEQVTGANFNNYGKNRCRR